MKVQKKNGLSFFENVLCALSRADIMPEKEIDRIGREMNEVCDEVLIHIKEYGLGTIPYGSFADYVDAYYQECTRLIESAAGLARSKPQKNKTLEMLIGCLERFCDCLERDYEKLIDAEARIPFPAQERVLDRIGKRFAVAKSRLPNGKTSDLLIGRMSRFVSAKDLKFEMTRRSLNYKLELLRGIENWVWTGDFLYYPPIEQFLIYVNFNSKTFIDLLLERINKHLCSKKNVKDRLVMLIGYYKTYNQLHRKPKLILNPGYHGLDTFVNNWFESEIDYYRQCNSLRVDAQLNPPLRSDHLLLPRDKLMCNLSSDQLAIYLRLLDDEKIVSAPSLSQVYQRLVPFLSTKKRIHLSASSVRVKSYHPEERDKLMVIRTLERMIRRVMEY